ncbi:MAG: phosphonoacetaldehyde hydrolase [Lachnospiraceae bacterium]|nr:phosphonoacetaldehyde hydrolase [Lachnospiraceae bacterium]
MEKGIQMVVFDWAGTTVDYGSSAPAEVFARIFRSEGIHFTRNEINGPMGMEKKAHIRALLSLETGSKQWEEIHGTKWTEEDVERLYEKFEEELFRVVAEYSTPIPGVVETVNELRRQGIKIGSTTGYNAQMMKQVLPKALQEGYQADCVVTPDVTGMGRPTPFMLFECMRQLKVYPANRVVKVGDTVVDMQEGKNAGACSIGILTGSNLLGLTQEEYEAMEPEELKRRKMETKKKYLEAGADMVIDSITELPAAIAKLNQRM